MDTALLCQWLGLPSGTPWPPDDRTLLNLPAGAINPSEAERRALKLMGQLRPHQLLHPELVTVGMNRLAQAMLSVSSHRPETAVPKRPIPKAPPPPAHKVEVRYEVVELDPGEKPVAPPAPVARPVILDAEPVAFEEEDAEVEPETPAIQYVEVVSSPEVVIEELPVVEAVEVPVLALPDGLAGESRRIIYRQLACLRAMRRAWSAVRLACASPSCRIETPGQVWTMLEGASEMQSALRHRGYNQDLMASLAPIVFGVFEQPQPLAVIRLLHASQRYRLAKDWATGQAKLDALEQGLRNSLASARPQASFRQQWRGFQAYLFANPEWYLVPPVVVLVIAALLRSTARTATTL
ncbi:MAG: hypothetical protein ACRC8S_18215 [Fimbriiglobus sp.]